jgi:hypothetical protein
MEIPNEALSAKAAAAIEFTSSITKKVRSIPMEEMICKPPTEGADWFEPGHSLGQNHAIAVIAGRCSAAQGGTPPSHA